MDNSVTARLVEFATETKYLDIPEEVLQFTKGLTLKTVAGMLAGSAKPPGRKMAALIKERRLPGDAGVIGSGFKTSLWESVFLNAFFAHASELEDDRYNGGVSWDITVIPLLLPLAEKLRLSGKALLEAMVIGLEVHTRTSLFSPGHLGLVVVPGAVGPAAGAARALGLDAKKMAAAIGMATSGVPLWLPNLGTEGHYLESALQSLHGIIAAEMSREGLRGTPNVEKYLTDLIGKERVVPEKIVADLGKRWFLCEIWVKKYPCCFLTHRQIDALLDLKKEHDIEYEQVESIEVHISRTDRPCDRPDPKTEGDLQFSYQHVLGTAMLDGDVRLEHISEDAIADPRLKEARSRVKVIVHRDWPIETMASPGRVVIKMKDGRELVRERMRPIGSPGEPLTVEQFRELYYKFSREVLSEEQISKTADLILNMEKLNDVDELMDRVVFRHRI